MLLVMEGQNEASITGFPLSSVWLPFGFPRKKWVPFINMQNGRVNDVTYCDNPEGKKGFLHTNEVSSQCLVLMSVALRQ